MSLLLTGVGATGINRYSQITDLIDLSVDPSRVLAGNAAQFYDLSYLVAGADINPLTSDLSIAGWIYVDSLASVTTILSAGAQDAANDFIWLFVFIDGSVRVQFNDGTGAYLSDQSAAGEVVVGQWYFLVWNFDRDGNCVVYKNGTPILTFSIATKATACSPSG